MYQHFPDPLSFRLSAWPWGGSSYIGTFNYRAHNILFKPILDYLKQELENSPTVKVRDTTFTLVNVFSGFTDMSYGPMLKPHARVRRGPVSFTFAMTRRQREFALPRQIIWNTGMTALWGPNLQEGHDYLTINLPIDLCVQCRLNNTLRRQLEWLYKICGGFTKAIALDRNSFSLRSDDVKLIHDNLYFKTIPQMMWRYPWEDWKYAREFWDRAPDVLELDTSDEFVRYFLTYQTKFFKKIDDPNVKPFFEEVQHIVRSGVLDMVQKQPTSVSSLVAPFVSSMDRHDIDAGVAVNVERIVLDICTGKGNG